ncbi:MAG: methyltransferase domain-containing protein [Planctomycetota bacterium]|nr:methyltransferase domain-containing protein [Planctomycetota bacterium]
MSTDYDPIAAQYRRAKSQPWRHHVELYTLLELIGPLDGLSVIDLACGDGFYTRLLRQRGAGRIDGVDLSQAMVHLAEEQELRQPLGIRYFVRDACDFRPDAPVDLVVAAYLLNYAEDATRLRAMCSSIARCLRPGGRFVAVNTNPGSDFPNAPDYRPYGFETRAGSPWGEGAPIWWTFHVDGQSIEVENYHLGFDTHRRVLEDAGFEDVRWHVPNADPSGATESPTGSWDTFLADCPIAFLDCRKRG